MITFVFNALVLLGRWCFGRPGCTFHRAMDCTFNSAGLCVKCHADMDPYLVELNRRAGVKYNPLDRFNT